VLHIWRLHCGTDFVRAGGEETEGSKLFAIAHGEVTKSVSVDDNPGGGNFIEIKHDDGTFTRYFHMKKRSRLRKGDEVDEGTIVGKAGGTGSWATGPHLHFEVLTKRRKPTDPVEFIKKKLAQSATAAAVLDEDEEEDDDMRTIQVHYKEDDGRIIRAMVTPGTAYFAPWQETGSSIANGLSRALESGSSVPVTKKMFQLLRESAEKLEPVERGFILHDVSNVDGEIVEDPGGFPLDDNGIPIDPILPDEEPIL
jgi:murein DD-endopeptidase MepM/ murein hydrolase activator NlpD